MKRYPEYRASGVEWIGEIPRGWSIVKVKHLTHQVIDGTHYTPEYQDGGIPFLRVTDIHNKTIDLTKVKYITPELHHELTRRCKPEKGNLLLSKNGTIGITRVIDWDFEFSIFVSLCLIKFRTETYSPYFFSYLFQSQVIDQQLRESSKTSTVTNLHLDKIRELFVVRPPIAKQHAIVDFLDRKTGQIDELIRIKEQRIELLQEQRTALINQAVTKGLDPNVEMKTSGVEWIGEIPKHWTISKVKHEFESLDNLRIPLNSETRGSMKLKIYDYYGASGVIDKVENYIFDEPLILIGEDGANLYLRSTPLAFKAIGKYWVNNHAHVLRLKHGNIDYLTNMLESLDYTHYITGAAQPKLTSDNLMNITVITPPPLEQAQIADFLDCKTQQIDQLITTEQRKFELLKEYRQSLISEAVTGKIDVRSEV